MQKIARIITQIIDFVYHPFRRYIPRELFRYGACGGGNMVLDWVLYFLLYNYVIGHELVYLSLGGREFCLTPHIATLCITFPITLLTGFWLNKYVTFTRSNLHGARQLLRYVSVVGVNLAINYFGLKLLVEHWGWYPTPSKIAITLLTIVFSFFAQKYFSFANNSDSIRS